MGGRLVTNKSKADLIFMPRSGAFSTEENSQLVGIPSFAIPIPLMASINRPEIALFAKEQARGVAKFAVVLCDANNGTRNTASGPFDGFSHLTGGGDAVLLEYQRPDPEERPAVAESSGPPAVVTKRGRGRPRHASPARPDYALR
jgi:hypothetical protein